MIKKEDFLNNNSIKIKSYNYEESNGFSQETAVDKHYATYKEHKFVISIEGEDYSLEFLHSHVVNKYAAMEDEWVEMDTVLEDCERLTIEKIKKKYPYSYEERHVVKDLNEDIEVFKNKLINSARELGIGCNHSNHRNREDDFGRIASDIESKAPYKISDEVLFIEEEEKKWFEEYLSLDTDEKEKKFFNNLKNRIENEKQQEEEKKNKIKEEKANIVDPLLEDLIQNVMQASSLEYYMESPPKASKYTIEEVQKEMDNTEKGEDIDYYYEKLAMLEGLKEEIVKIKELENEILKHISEEELEYSWKNGSYTDVDPEEPEEYYPEPDIEEPEFGCEEDWIEYQYSQPRTMEERFEAIKKYIKNELEKDIIPNELKEKFKIKNEITEFLNNKVNENQPEQKTKRKNKLN